MMGMALSGKWSSPPEIQHPVSSQPGIPETLEAEVVEPVEADGQK
jgi:heat shock protein beta